MKIDEKEYQKMLDEDWAWANNQIKMQNEDPRPLILYRNHRPIINLKQMLESTHDLYKDNAAFYTKFEKGPYQKITYDMFYNDINSLGTKLINLGFKDKRIMIIGETQYMWAVSYFSVVAGTGIAVPIDKELPYDDLKNLVKESEAEVVIFDKKRESMFTKMLNEGETTLKFLISQDRREDENVEGCEVHSIWKLIEDGKKLLEEGNRDFLDAQINSREMAVLIFTSGTTGMAKGIMLSHRNFCSDIMESPSILNVVPEDIFFSILPIHHTFEMTCVFLEPIYKGASIAHCEGLKHIVKNMQEVHPTFLLAVPAIFEALHRSIFKGIEKKGKTKTVKTMMKLANTLHFSKKMRRKIFKDILDNLGGNFRTFICGGAAINPKILDDFNTFGITSVQGYGLSETAPIGALNPDQFPKSNAVGIHLPSYDAKIDDKGEDGVGEICLKGDNLMLGYYKRPDLTSEAIIDGWFHTGDLGYIDEDGYIVITGRKKNVIITKNGKNVFPEELEYQLSLNPEIAESMVFEGSSENKDDTLIVACIYPNYETLSEIMGEDSKDDEKVKAHLWKIIDKLNEENPPYKMIREMRLRHTEFIKNTSKKIKRFVPENKQAN